LQNAPASIAPQVTEVGRPPAAPVPLIRRPAIVAAVFGVLATIFRLWLVAGHYPRSDSDEATIGLAALHMAAGQDFPIWFYGQHYMGTAEAFLAAPLVAVGGPSTLMLRLPLVALYAVFLVLMYRLVAGAYSAWFAVLVVGVLALGSDRVIKDQLIARGGTGEVKAAAAALLLLAFSLAVGWQRRRAWGFFAWGLVAGLSIWTHLVILPYLLVAAGILVVCRGRELIGRMGAYLCAGLVAGAAPMITYNVIAAPGQDTLSIFLRQNDGPSVPLLERLGGGILVGVPLSTGVCDPSDCRPWQRAWAPVVLILLAASAVLAVRALRRMAPLTRLHRVQDPERARQLARFALALAALLSILAYSRSPAAGVTPIESARYLNFLSLSVPAVLWPLWTLTVSGFRRWRARAALAGGVLAAFLATMVTATLAMVTIAVPDARADTREQRELVEALDSAGVRHVYSVYWTCNRISFDSGERIRCAVLTGDLTPGFDRYRPYRAAAAGDSHPAYVFEMGSEQDARLRAWLRESGVPDAPARTVGHYHVYLPGTRHDLP
jgi:hypothetical protein